MKAIISWDVAGYYWYLPAFFYDDPGEMNNYDHLQQIYNPGGNYQALKAPKGNYIMKYSCGQALMYLPAFICGHVAANVFSYTVDGFSLPYQIAINIQSLAIGCLGLWLLGKILKKYFADQVVAAAIIIIALASNYLQYSSLDNAFSHNYLFTLYCIIILLTIRWHERPQISSAILLGLCCGLAALTRPTEMITVMIPLLWAVYDRPSIIRKILMLRRNLLKIAAFFCAAIAVGILQLIYWKLYAGSWLYFSYGEDQTFSWLRPHVWNVLMSYQKGWLIYTPVMILSISGFITLYRYHRDLFFIVFIYFLVFFYLVSAWDNWLYGGSFSMRAMIQSYPLLGISLASFIEWMALRKIVTGIVLLFIGLCIWLNGVMTYQAYFSPVGIIDGSRMNAKYYWRVFGKTKISISDRKFLETNEEIPFCLQNKLSEVYFNDFEHSGLANDNSKAFSGSHSFMINDRVQYSPLISIPVNEKEKCWYRVSAKVFPAEMEWDILHQAQMLVALSKGSKKVKEKYFRIYGVISPNWWQDINLDINGVIAESYDSLRVSFWNAEGKKTMYFDDIRIEKVPVQ